jgi:DNA-binding MarR family transcriptional regulator
MYSTLKFAPSVLMSSSPLFPEFHLIHKAGRRADQLFARYHSDLTPRQFIILAALDGKGGMSQTDISRATGIDRSTMTELLRRLQRQKFVSRRRLRDDARTYSVRVTAAGVDALASARHAARRTDETLLGCLTGAQRSQLIQALQIIVEAADEPAPHDKSME